MTTVEPTLTTKKQQSIDDSASALNISDNKNAVCKHDLEFATGIRQPKKKLNLYPDAHILSEFETALGVTNISADPRKNEHFRKGWRSGGGAALAVIFPQTLEQLWNSIKIAVSNNLIIVMQAANTGLTEGSTPNKDNYDRPVIVINTLSYLLLQP